MGGVTWRWVFNKHWHPEAGIIARLRALWLIVVRRWETEICGRCGRGVAACWHAPTPLWLAASGYPSKGGVLCMRCFNDLADRSGLNPWWEVGEREFPGCHGSPCAHEETMRFQRGEIERLWSQLQKARAQCQS